MRKRKEYFAEHVFSDGEHVRDDALRKTGREISEMQNAEAYDEIYRTFHPAYREETRRNRLPRDRDPETEILESVSSNQS